MLTVLIGLATLYVIAVVARHLHRANAVLNRAINDLPPRSDTPLTGDPTAIPRPYHRVLATIPTPRNPARPVAIPDTNP